MPVTLPVKDHVVVRVHWNSGNWKVCSKYLAKETARSWKIHCENIEREKRNKFIIVKIVEDLE